MVRTFDEVVYVFLLGFDQGFQEQVARGVRCQARKHNVEKFSGSDPDMKDTTSGYSAGHVVQRSKLLWTTDNRQVRFSVSKHSTSLDSFCWRNSRIDSTGKNGRKQEYDIN